MLVFIASKDKDILANVTKADKHEENIRYLEMMREFLSLENEDNK